MHWKLQNGRFVLKNRCFHTYATATANTLLILKNDSTHTFNKTGFRENEPITTLNSTASKVFIGTALEEGVTSYTLLTRIPIFSSERIERR